MSLTANISTSLSLHKVRFAAANQEFHPLGTVRCVGKPMFRSQDARDLACLLDVDPDVVSWACLPLMLQLDGRSHIPDFAVTRATEVVLVDIRPAPDWVNTAAQDAGYRYDPNPYCSGGAEYRLINARDLLRYAAFPVSLGDRIRLLTFLEEQGSMPLSACVQLIQDSRDAIGVIASMALGRLLEIDIDSGLIGPETRVSRA